MKDFLSYPLFLTSALPLFAASELEDKFRVSTREVPVTSFTHARARPSAR